MNEVILMCDFLYMLNAKVALVGHHNIHIPEVQRDSISPAACLHSAIRDDDNEIITNYKVSFHYWLSYVFSPTLF